MLFTGSSHVKENPSLEINESSAQQANRRQVNQRQQAQVVIGSPNSGEWRFRPPASRYLSSGDSSSDSTTSDDEGVEHNRVSWPRRPPPRYRPPPAVLNRPQHVPYVSIPDRLDYLVPDIVRQCNNSKTIL